MAKAELAYGVTVNIPLAGLSDELADNPVLWRQGLEHRAEAAILPLGAEFVGAGTGFGGTDFQYSVPLASLAAVFAALGEFLASQPDVPDGTVVSTYDSDYQHTQEVTVGELRAGRSPRSLPPFQR